jgi:hypothetical protein
MSNHQALHICLPNEDNLGDELAHKVVDMALEPLDTPCRLHKVDLWQLRSEGRYLDDDIETINREYRFVVIGGGGLLSPGLINYVFKDPNKWAALKIPLFLFGVGIIANNTMSNQYYGVGPNSDAPLAKALQASSLVAVRDMRTWLTVVRILPAFRERLFLTGCPTLFYTGNGHELTEKTHELALNIPFGHGACGQYAEKLLEAARLILTYTDSVRWICHSKEEKAHAQEISMQLNKPLDVVYPRTIAEVRDAYGRCKTGLVTKAHAALFCLANNVPFGFFSYDMKCDALMEMIADFPNHYLCHVEQLPKINIAGKIYQIIYALKRDEKYIKQSQKILLQSLRREFDRFVSALKAMVL